MRRTNIFWATLPMTLCFVIVISVNIYVIKVILAQKSSVAPTVTLPPAPSTDQLELEAGQGEGRTIQKILGSFRQMAAFKIQEKGPNLKLNFTTSK